MSDQSGQVTQLLEELKGLRTVVEGLRATEARQRQELAELQRSEIPCAKKINEQKKNEDCLNRLQECFLDFTADPLENIGRLTALCGELTGATCALYNRLEGDVLCALGTWNTPPDFQTVDQPDGHICYDVIRQGGDELFIVRDLPSTSYFITDANVLRYNLRTYVGKSVTFAGSPVGSLCLVFQDDYDPDTADRRMISLIAAAISIEEERRHALEVLSQSENFVHKILDTVDEGVIVIEKDFRISSANNAYCREVGETEGMIVGKHCYEVSHRISRPCDEEGEECPVRQAFVTGEYHKGYHRHLNSRGAMLYVEVKAFPIKDENGEVLSVIETINNITARHLLEEERLKAEKMAAIGMLAGGIAHDFNNLLQGVFGYIAMAKTSLDQAERARAMLEQAEKALHLTVGLTTQLLTFSKGGKPLKKETDLRSIVDNAVKFSLSGSQVSPRIICDENLSLVDADEGQIGQVIQNLVLNADQAMPLGGTITIALRNRQVSESNPLPLLKYGRYVEIIVQDTGIGIPEQFLPKIFDPYFTTKEKGSGLGLTTSYSIIRNHGGTIEVTSDAGRGTSFFLYLPAIESVKYQTGRETLPHVSRKGRILVMDDEEMVRDVIGELIQSLGHEVELVAHGEAAVDKYREALVAGHPFDIVILDLTIRGGMGGAEAMKGLLTIDPEVKSVVSSGYSDGSMLSEHQTQGFKKCLKKPFRVEELQNVLNELLLS